MTDVTVVVLVGREERHIRRCLERLAPLEPRQIVVVESQKGDRTHEIALEMREKLLASHSSLLTIFHDWPGTQARQFNWILDELNAAAGDGRSRESKREISRSRESKSKSGIEDSLRGSQVGSWILRLDADEYLTPDTIERLRSEVEVDDGRVGVFNKRRDAASPLAFTFELKRRFCGGEIRHGTNGIRQVRMFRRGCARYDEGLMDERLVVRDCDDQRSNYWSQTAGLVEVESRSRRADGGVATPPTIVQPSTSNLQPKSSDSENAESSGMIVDFPGAFYDDSLMPMDEWREKHRKYAKREAAQAIASLKSGEWTDPRKAKYYRLPRYLRAFAYFCVRYFLKGGILDGYAGWMWNFWQGLWYRWIVDREMGGR